MICSTSEARRKSSQRKWAVEWMVLILISPRALSSSPWPPVPDQALFPSAVPFASASRVSPELSLQLWSEQEPVHPTCHFSDLAWGVMTGLGSCFVAPWKCLTCFLLCMAAMLQGPVSAKHASYRWAVLAPWFFLTRRLSHAWDSLPFLVLTTLPEIMLHSKIPSSPSQGRRIQGLGA